MEQIEELAVRLLSYQWLAGPSPTVQLLAGQVPSDLPLELPQPPDARLLGSATYRRDGRPSQVVVVLDTGASPEETIDFYRREMPVRGWSPAPLGWAPGGGFVPATVLATAAFCRSQAGPWLSVSARPQEVGPTAVRIEIDLLTPGPCREPAGRIPDAGDRVPPLTVPPGVRLYPDGGGGSDHDWSSNALAETELSAADLEAHFARQLETRGWERLAEGAGRPVAWSLWRLPGEEDWQGILTVAEWPGRNLRSLSIRIQSSAMVEGGWAYFA